jgi:hypothetical protein
MVKRAAAVIIAACRQARGPQRSVSGRGPARGDRAAQERHGGRDEWNQRRGTGESIPDLSGADLGGARCGNTIFGDVDLSDVKGLASIKHAGLSTVGIDTLFRSGGKIPDAFLRECGVPEALIVQQRALVGSLDPIQFYLCFISYRTKNQDFAERLHSRLRNKGLRVWFAPETMPWGTEIHKQIDEATRLYDQLLLILSSESMASDWVKVEIRKALRAEDREERRKLFPLRLVDFEAIQTWECIEDNGKGLGVEVRRLNIGDFSNWKDHDSFEKAFDRLLSDLKVPESTVGKGP